MSNPEPAAPAVPTFAAAPPTTLVEIADALTRLGAAVRPWLVRIPPAAFFADPPTGWSPARNLLHLQEANDAVARALLLPGWLPRLLFGRATSPSRSYGQMRDDYRHRLQGGAGAGRYAPRAEKIAAPTGVDRQQRLENWQASLARLTRRLPSWSEAAADTCRLPHPILGKLTLREMLFFTLYHNVHHLTNVAERSSAAGSDSP